MKIGILKEIEGDRRVALLPENVSKLQQLKTEVLFETGAGSSAHFCDQEYIDAGAEVKSGEEVRKQSDLLIRIHPFTRDEISQLSEGKVLLSLINPLHNKELIESAAGQGLTTISLDMIPRTTRAQSMDVLSSMATTAGYKAVLDAANHLPSFFPMFMTAAGTIKPAKILILGAGVAGLQAIATARKLGGVVEAFDVRSNVKEEVESLGGRFIEVAGSKEAEESGGYAVEQTEDYKRKQQELVHEHAVKSDVIITTAQIPGKKAPILLKKETVGQMRHGAVIIDLAASSGGNCELTKNNEEVVHNGVTIIGNSNYPSELPADASKMFGNNLVNFLKLIIDQEGNLNLNFDDDIVSNATITYNNEIIHEKLKE
jgi:NAD(P) transhydrogenase subunit alpha